VFFLFEALLGILVIPADFGIRGAIEKRISEGSHPGRILTGGILLKIIPLAVFLGAIMFLRGVVNDYVNADIAIWLMVGLVTSELYQLGLHVLSGELRVGETAVLRVTQKVVWVGVGILLIQEGYSYFGPIFGAIAGNVTSFLWGMLRRDTPFDRPRSDDFRSLLAYSRYNFVSAISGYFYSWMDVLLIGLFLTAAHVGVYETAWRVTAVAVLASTAVAQSMFPQISRWDAEQAVARIEQLLPKIVIPSIITVVPAFFGTLIFSRQILGIVFGPEYSTAWLALIVLMAEKVFQSVHNITGRALQAIDHPEYAAPAAIIAILINLVLNVPLIGQFGIAGAAVATMVSFVINTFLCAGYLSRFLTIRIPWSDIVWIVVSSIGMAVTLFGWQLVVTVDTLPVLTITVLVGVAIYAVFVLASRSLRLQILHSVRTIRGTQSPGETAGQDD